MSNSKGVEVSNYIGCSIFLYVRSKNDVVLTSSFILFLTLQITKHSIQASILKVTVRDSAKCLVLSI